MTGREIGAVVNAVLSVANALQQLGNNYYAATAAWEEFPKQVATLQDRHSMLVTQLERYDRGVGRAAREAEKLLLKEMKTLEKRQEREKSDGCGKVWSCASLAKRRIGETAFPKKIGLALGDVIRAYDSIGEQLRKNKEIEENFRFLASNSPMELPFCDDVSNLYVHLTQTESDISSAIRKVEPGSPNVVLLFGGPGTGKSTLSRHITLKHKSDFAHVVWLECGPRVDPDAIALKLLQYLGWAGEFLEKLEKSVETGHSEGTKRSRLQKLLDAQKVLITLDDLQQSEILQELLTSSGPGVKYLVTSQHDGICADLTCTLIRFEIQNLHKPDAKEICRKMLAVHIGYTDGNIPDQFQEMADRLLDRAEGVPLVISTLGAQLGKADHYNPAVWKYLLDHPYHFLIAGKPSKYIHGIPYLNSYWSALMQSISSIETEEKQLILLLGMCRDASVPKAVVFFLLSTLFSEEKGNILEFSRMTKELKSRQLLAQKRQSHLQIHSLTKRFLIEQMEQHAICMAESFVQKISLIEQVANNSACVTRATVIRVLICLYLDLRFLSPIADHMGQSHATFSDTKKTAVEPITLQLLELDVNWTEEFHQSACQVFLDFVRHDSLCNDHLSRLFQCSSWVMPTLKFLQSTSVFHESFWGKNNIHGILHIFEKLVGLSDQPHIQMQAAQTLEALVLHRANREITLRATGLLHQLVNLMSRGLNADVQCSGARFFVSCSRSIDDDLSYQKLLNFPPFLLALVDSLADDLNARLQMLAANTLLNLASTSNAQIILQMVSFSPLLDRLATSLRKRWNPELQVNAAWAIANLAGAGANQASREQIASHPRLLDNLEISLDQDDNPRLRLWAARALIQFTWTKDISKLLWILAESLEIQEDPDCQESAAAGVAALARVSDTMRDRILNFPGLLESLIRSLDNDVNSGLQKDVTRALDNLALSSDPSINIQILSSPSLLRSLAASLSKRLNPELQVNAARAIANLAGPGANQAMMEQIASHPGLLDNLEISLDQDDNGLLRVWAARALIQLAWTKDISKLLQIFTESLETPEDPHRQESAARGLAAAARVSDTIKNQILNFPRLLETLIKSLDNDVNSGLQTLAAGALVDLASSSEPSIIMQLLSSPLLLRSLAASLRKPLNPELQVNAARAIANLAGPGASQAERELIASHPGLLDNLEIGLDQDDNPHLRVWAARALITLAWTKDISKLLRILAGPLEIQQDPDHDLQLDAAVCLVNLADAKQTSMKAQMLNFPFLMDSVVASLRKHQNPALQALAANIIANLGGDGADEVMRAQIMNFPGLLDDLENSLDRDDNPKLLVGAARALVNLAPSKEVAGSPGGVTGTETGRLG